MHHFARRFRVKSTVLILLALTAACIDAGSLRDLMTLQAGIATEFKEPAVSINLMNKVALSVTLQNSPNAKLPPDERAVFARRVALFVRDHYPGYEGLTTVAVGFSTRRGAGPVNFTRTERPYVFKRADLAPAVRDSTAAGNAESAT